MHSLTFAILETLINTNLKQGILFSSSVTFQRDKLTANSLQVSNLEQGDFAMHNSRARNKCLHEQPIEESTFTAWDQVQLSAGGRTAENWRWFWWKHLVSLWHCHLMKHVIFSMSFKLRHKQVKINSITLTRCKHIQNSNPYTSKSPLGSNWYFVALLLHLHLAFFTLHCIIQNKKTCARSLEI